MPVRRAMRVVVKQLDVASKSGPSRGRSGSRTANWHGQDAFDRLCRSRLSPAALRVPGQKRSGGAARRPDKENARPEARLIVRVGRDGAQRPCRRPSSARSAPAAPRDRRSAQAKQDVQSAGDKICGHSARNNRNRQDRPSHRPGSRCTGSGKKSQRRRSGDRLPGFMAPRASHLAAL
jgi:hypothetical protein